MKVQTGMYSGTVADSSTNLFKQSEGQKQILKLDSKMQLNRLKTYKHSKMICSKNEMSSYIFNDDRSGLEIWQFSIIVLSIEQSCFLYM